MQACETFQILPLAPDLREALLLAAASPAQRRFKPSWAKPFGRVKSAIAELFSTLLQRRIVARIDRMGEEFRFRPGPELTDILVGLDDLIPQLEAVFGAVRAAAPDIEIADHVAEVVELDRAAGC